MFKEFMEFLRKYGVIALAIAVVIGGKLNLLVSSLVNDLLTPLLFQPALKAAGAENISELSYNGIMYGRVVAALLDFVIVAFIVFLSVRWLMKKGYLAQPATPGTPVA